MAKKKGTAYEELVAVIVGSFFRDDCKITQGSWANGPDGRRDMDVLIEGFFKDANIRLLVECKDYDKAKTGRVGIEIIDALDSKRSDLSIDKCLICSNAGFTDPALRKAKRKGIGAISVLRSGDERVKIEIVEKIFYQVIGITKSSYKFNLYKASDGFDPADVFYRKRPVYLWAQEQLALDPNNLHGREAQKSLERTFRFKNPFQIKSKGRKHLLSSIDAYMDISRTWYSQDVRLDAKSAIYDYLSGQISLSPGLNQLSIHGLGITEKSGVREPELPDQCELGLTFNDSKDRLAMSMIEGVNFRSDHDIPYLNPYILQEDIIINTRSS